MRLLARCLAVLGCAALLVGLVAGVVNRQVLDAQRFADHVDTIRTDDAVARQVGVLVTDELIRRQPDVQGLRPVLESATASLVASSAFGPVVRTTVAPLYRALATDDDSQVVLRLADIAALVVAAVTTLSPDAAAVVPDDLDVTLASIGAQSYSDDVVAATHLVDRLSWLAPVLGGLLLAASGAVRTRTVRGAVRTVGRGAVAAAALLGVLLFVVGAVVGGVDTSTLPGAVTVAGWDALDGAFWAATGAAAAVGALLWLLTLDGGALDARSLVAGARRRWEAPTPQLRVQAGAAAVGLGVLLVLRPLTLVSVVVAVLGVVVAGAGLQVLLTGVRDLLARTRPQWRVPSSAVLRGALATVVLAAGLGVVGVGALAGDEEWDAVAAPVATCNGYVELIRPGESGELIRWKDHSHGTTQQVPDRVA